MTKAEKKIRTHIANANGLTSPGVAHQVTGYAISTCVRIFKSIAVREDDGTWFLKSRD